jgi:phage tail sheath protein FI
MVPSPATARRAGAVSAFSRVPAAAAHLLLLHGRAELSVRDAGMTDVERVTRTTTQDDIDKGRLACLVGVAAVEPAEFVIFRIGQWTGGDDDD